MAETMKLTYLADQANFSKKLKYIHKNKSVFLQSAIWYTLVYFLFLTVYPAENIKLKHFYYKGELLWRMGDIISVCLVEKRYR